jgi:hypothetical protein
MPPISAMLRDDVTARKCDAMAPAIAGGAPVRPFA